MQNYDPNQPPQQPGYTPIEQQQQPGYAPIPPPSGQYGGYYQQGPVSGAASSGMGAASVLPAELRGFNWGAFLVNWIWSIAHNTWIGLLCFIPYVGFVMAFVLGFKGNEWAWQNRKWESIEQFREVQRIWMWWGIGLFIVGMVFWIAFIMLFGALIMSHPHTTYQPGTFTPPQTSP